MVIIIIIIVVFLNLRPTEFADPVETLQAIPFDDQLTSFSTVPMMYGNHSLASDWPEQFLRRTYRYAIYLVYLVLDIFIMISI